MRAALIQITASDDPVANLPVTAEFVRRAAGEGADLVLTPEVTNIVSASRTRQNAMLASEEEDRTLAGLRAVAAECAVWLSIGSLALKSDDPEGRFVNRQFLIAPSGDIMARYDKIHMFDVELGGEESYRESKGYRPGEQALVVDTDLFKLGLSICYDMRFPGLYRDLAQAGAQVLTVPSAFTVPTGRAHWEVLLRARAIETGCFVLAAAQTGTHKAVRGRVRQTYGHSLVVTPWGEVLADAGEEPGITLVDLNLADVDKARSKVPSLSNGREYTLRR